MDNLYIKGQKYIPEVNFNAETGILEISGQSYLEFTDEFYEPVFNWIKEFLSTPGRTVTLNFKLSYFNTASSRALLTMMELIEGYEDCDKATINWYYKKDDYDMLESGEDYQADINLNINFIEY